jgi:aryl-phospho-beta-D-glucosidase BglC (GH1 family)
MSDISAESDERCEGSFSPKWPSRIRKGFHKTMSLQGRYCRRGIAAVCVFVAWTTLGAVGVAHAETTPAVAAPLHTTGTDSLIYDMSNRPVRLVGFNWGGTDRGGRKDYNKAADVCGLVWRTPADPIVNGVAFNDFYSNVRAWGYNTIRLPISWHNLEPVAPIWSSTNNRYVHTFSPAYVNDLKSIVSKARAAGLSIILDMHQDFWSPALHNIKNWDGTQGYCEGAGMPRWLYPSIDAKAQTTQNTDFYNGMNWFFRDVHDPGMTLTRQSPWQMFYSAWDYLSYTFSSRSGYPDYSAVIGADIINEPWYSYVGGNPPAGQTVLQAAGNRLRTFYNALAPAITRWNPTWLLFFEDGTGAYNTANPSARETPMLTAKPSASGQWVYSSHIYNFGYGTFNDGVQAHDDRGINVANALLGNATAWKVPLYLGEFSNFTLKPDARLLTDSDMTETKEFLTWAKTKNVSWTFWCYTQYHVAHIVVDYETAKPIPVVKNALATGL